MNLFRPILGLGFLAGAAVAAVKLVHLYDRVQDGEWTAVMGEVPEEEYTVPAPQTDERGETPADEEAAEPGKPAAEPEKPAAEPEEPAAEPEEPAVEPETPAAEPETPAAETAALEEAAVPEDAPEAEQKAPERVTVRPRRARIDPTTIARAEDFQDWDDFGCRG